MAASLQLLTLLLSAGLLTVAQEAADVLTDINVENETPLPPRDPTLVSVEQGLLRGAPDVAFNGKQFYKFLGVPFAEPPVGKRRFQPPSSFLPWTGERPALQQPPRCPQASGATLFKMAPFELVGEEDCLYLNVFSPMPETSTQLLPIMVFIHGGGYIFGGAKEYSPQALMMEDIVLVVIQYRLGTLGFLSTEDDVAPGNMGILDQTLALKWTQRNAVAFGGDPLKITIFGESAGASSVHLQILSHTSLGFFHRAIMQSGNALTPWALGRDHRQVAYFMAKMLGCEHLADVETANCTPNEEQVNEYNNCLVDSLPSEKVMQCLQEKPLDKLVELSLYFFKVGFLPLLLGPRVDPNLLMLEPAQLLKEGRFKKLDIMMGVTSDEGGTVTLSIFANEGLRSAMHHKFHEMGPASLDFRSGDIAPLNQTIRIYDRYVGSAEFDRETADKLTEMFGDRLFWYPMDTSAHLHVEDYQSKRKSKKIYVYEFAYRGQYSIADIYGLDVGKHWVPHADDLFYLFGAPFEEMFAMKTPLQTEEDKKMRDVMVKMWTNFAATGNPTPEDSPVSWLPFTAATPHVLLISENTALQDDKKGEVREFWRQLPLKENFILFKDRVANLTVEVIEDIAQKPPQERAADISHDSGEAIEADTKEEIKKEEL